jgi:hypothetical protein
MEHYHLKWNAHHDETFSAFESLLAEEAFADVVLSCRGMALRAHRLVLSACSSYFRQVSSVFFFECVPTDQLVFILRINEGSI